LGGGYFKQHAKINHYPGALPPGWVGLVAPTEVRCEFLKSSFFVVVVFLWPNRVIIRINMHRKATRNPHMVPWGWSEGRKKYLFLSLCFTKKYFYLSTLLNSNKKTLGVNIDLN
jgi:hypothetical protein